MHRRSVLRPGAPNLPLYHTPAILSSIFLRQNAQKFFRKLPANASAGVGCAYCTNRTKIEKNSCNPGYNVVLYQCQEGLTCPPRSRPRRSPGDADISAIIIMEVFTMYAICTTRNGFITRRYYGVINPWMLRRHYGKVILTNAL